MRLNTSAIVIAHLIRGDDDGDEALRAAHFLPPGLLDRPMAPGIAKAVLGSGSQMKLQLY